MKLDIEAVRLSENDRDPPTESYKQISEFSAANSKNSTGEFLLQLYLNNRLACAKSQIPFDAHFPTKIAV